MEPTIGMYITVILEIIMDFMIEHAITFLLIAILTVMIQIKNIIELDNIKIIKLLKED